MKCEHGCNKVLSLWYNLTLRYVNPRCELTLSLCTNRLVAWWALRLWLSLKCSSINLSIPPRVNLWTCLGTCFPIDVYFLDIFCHFSTEKLGYLKKINSASSISFSFLGKKLISKNWFKKNPWLQCAFVIAFK